LARFKVLYVFIIIILVLITALGVLQYFGLEIPYLSVVGKVIFNFVSPVLDYFSNAYRAVSNYWYGLLNVKEILAEKDQMEKEIASLEMEIKDLKRYKFWNERLRELLDFKVLVPSFTTKGATVIAYSPSNWENLIVINRGIKDNISINMPVISYNGMLVGKVVYVGENSSKVLLLNSPEYVVGAIVQRQDSRAIGLVKGQINDEVYNIMDNLSWDASIKKGDIIVSSGLSSNYPRGIPIGLVDSVELDNYGLSQKAKIKLFMSEKTIEEVLIVTDFNI